jgi:hypothetical protein
LREVLLTAAAQADEDEIVRTTLHRELTRKRNRMRAFEGRDDALAARKVIESLERLRIGDVDVRGSTGALVEGVLGPDTWLVEPGADRVRLAHSSLIILQHVRARTVQNADASGAE